MALLTTEQLKETITQVIPTIYEKRSALTAAGASAVDYNTTNLEGYYTGGAAVVGEGEIKPTSSIAFDEWDVETITLVHIITVTNQFLDTPEGRRKAQTYIEQAAESLVESSDVAILHGTNPATGSEVARLQDNAITPNGFQVVQEVDEEADVAVWRGLVEGDNDNFVLLSKPGLHGIQYAQQNGVAKYQLARKDAAFPFWASDAQSFNAVGVNGRVGKDYINNDVLSVSGDFSGVYRAFSPVNVTFSEHANIGDESMFFTNKVAYRIEQNVKFFNTNPSGFTVVRSADEA